MFIWQALSIIVCALAAMALVQSAADAAAPAGPPDPFDQNKRLARGVNVIGYDPLWRDPAAGRFAARHFRLIREAGFDHIRVNLHPFRDAKPDAAGQLPERYLKTLDWVLDNALKAGLLVVLDFHEFNSMSKDPAGLQAKYLAVWDQLARHVKDRPADVLFELLNEPHDKLTPDLWNQYLLEALALVRKSNPARTVIIGPGQWNGIGQLPSLRLPDDDRNLIVTVHYYAPMPFTHQGAPWSQHKDKTDIPWNGTDAELKAIAADFDKAQAWSAENRRPLYLGEFGAYDKADMASRARYTAAVARAAEQRGWSWAYWQFDSDFILYDIPAGKWVQPIRDALVPPR